MKDLWTATAEAYRDALFRLCPPGNIWVSNQEPDTRWAQLLLAIGAEFARLHNRGLDLIVDMDPRTTEADFIDAYERNAGLPDPFAPVPTVLADRRDALHAQITAFGGQNPTYFINVAANLGVTITITEPGFAVIAWAHYWMVHAPAEITRARAGEARAGEPLSTYSDLGQQLIAFLERIKPKHTIIIWLD